MFPTKIIFFTLISFFSYSGLFSQLLPGGQYEDNERGGKKAKNSSINDISKIEISIRSSQMIGNSGIEYQLGISQGIAKNISLGGEYFSLLSHNIVLPNDNNITNFSMPFLRISGGGIKANYLISQSKPFFLSFGNTLGISELSYSNTSSIDVFSDAQGHWVIYDEFGVNSDIRISSNYYLSLAMNYRYFFPFDYLNIKNTDLSNLVFKAGISLYF